VNTELLINSIVQQTMVFVAQLATAGGVRAPLAHVADQVFLDLTRELHKQGVTKKVIADMFGMALRTYHRRARELSQSGTQPDRTVWEAVLDYVRSHEPISAARVYDRFRGDDQEVVAGVLNDLVDSSLAYRSGRGETAVYRLADDADFGESDDVRHAARRHIVWLSVYRSGPLTLEHLSEQLRSSVDNCRQALDELLAEGKVKRSSAGFASDHFEVPVGQSHGWEAAVLDHYQAMVNAIAAKLGLGSNGSRPGEVVGGATYTFDLPEGHPLEDRVLSSLGRIREQMEELRGEVDAINRVSNGRALAAPDSRQVIFYMGQSIKH
jgi:hypothetical protein